MYKIHGSSSNSSHYCYYILNARLKKKSASLFLVLFSINDKNSCRYVSSCEFRSFREDVRVLERVRTVEKVFGLRLTYRSSH